MKMNKIIHILDIKDKEERKKAICEILGIDLSAHGTKLAPLGEDEPENVEHYDKVKIPKTWRELPKWMPR